MNAAAAAAGPAAATEILHDPDRRLWLLSGPRTSYLIALREHDILVNLYWGPRISLADAAEISDGHLAGGASSFGAAGDGREEYPVDGGPRFAQPALAVQRGTVRGIEWTHRGASAEGTGLRLDFHDAGHALDIALHYRLRPGHDILERWTELTYHGAPAAPEEFTAADAPLELLRADAAAWPVPARDGYRLSRLHGRWAAETQLTRGPLARGTTVLASRYGHTSHAENPWFALDDGTADEEHGEVWSAALAWSGSWRIAVQQLSNDAVQAVGGPGHDDSGVARLEPGESYTSPVFAGLYSDGGHGAASRAWHAWQRAHIVPDADQVRPVLYNSWEATGFDLTEQGQKDLATLAAGLGVELFTTDDGWFGERVNDRAGLGDWTPNPDRFPDGLAPLAEHVRSLGMKFGIWVEPEMVNPDSELYRAHPEWAQHRPGRRRTEMRNQLVLNVAREDVQEYLFQQLDALLSSAPIDFVKWDMNRPFTDAGWPGEPYPRRLYLDHTRGVYRIMDRLRSAHPGLAIESCSGGGGRIDLGVLQRTDQVWTSDNTDPLDRLTIQHGFSQIYPARVMCAWATDSPNWLNGRVTSQRYRMRSAMAGVLGLGGDLTECSEEELAELAERVAEYKTVRHLVQLGELYRLRGTGDGTTVVEYAAADGAEAVVLGWRQGPHFGASAPRVRLRGLDASARYRTADGKAEHSGSVLMRHGLELAELKGEELSSTLVHLVRV
ncbi:alpha-galactosidase [Mangrovactinospora gilvigrisea]|uniref:Alpha-galactosidase n=1 Tax=Mangrovactinospora gilvigrisea TaxID=1428644 RepID=A0A1J7BB00_9ACTN|nr:alpha-galactosidase [Mangrovactinospora gilvigrisea]OIV35798.1 alpha-galactosidase [Mangrovactinospora gilvigrisea]